MSKQQHNNDLAFLNGPSYEVAPRLLGCELERRVGDHLIRVKIVETEAYDQNDLASHSYKGETTRTKIMFGQPGYLYVYFTYGLHYCCNIVVGQEGHGAAVLIRAVEPILGESYLENNRPGQSGVNLTNGPAKLCQALAIDKTLNGHNLIKAPLKLIAQPALRPDQIKSSKRIGISKATDVPWRYYIDGNHYVSKI